MKIEYIYIFFHGKIANEIREIPIGIVGLPIIIEKQKVSPKTLRFVFVVFVPISVVILHV